MKNFLVAFIFFFGTVSAAPFPGDENFSSWSNFEGMVSKIYQDVRQEDEEQICERVLQWPDFWEEGELIFSFEDCLEFADTGGLSSFVNTHNASKENIARWIEVFRVKYNLERSIWKQEHSLIRETGLAYIWNDGDGGVENPPSADKELVSKKRTSSVDLVFVWNQIDHILFGVQATYPEFAALNESDDARDEGWVELPETDFWLDQRAENLPSYTPESDRYYEDGEQSIVGGYEEKAHMFEEELNVHSLIPGRATTGTFDSPFTGAPVPMSTGMNFYTGEAIPESPDIPEQESIREQVPLGELEGAFAKFFREQSIFEIRDTQNNLARTDALGAFLDAETQRNQEFSNTVDALLQTRRETELQDTGQLELLPIQQFNTLLDAWISVLEKWEDTNKSFLTHDKK